MIKTGMNSQKGLSSEESYQYEKLKQQAQSLQGLAPDPLNTYLDIKFSVFMRFLSVLRKSLRCGLSFGIFSSCLHSLSNLMC